MLSAAVVVGLSAGQKAGLGVAAGAFILFAVLVAFVVPERWPDFPGPAGLRPFLAATAALFVGMMLAVFFLARESEESGAAAHPPGSAGAVHVAEVTEVEYKIRLPATSVERGIYTFDLKNEGKEVHNLAVEGQGVSAETPTIGPGETAKLEVELKSGSYELYCSVPGHRELGMTAKLTVT